MPFLGFVTGQEVAKPRKKPKSKQQPKVVVHKSNAPIKAPVISRRYVCKLNWRSRLSVLSTLSVLSFASIGAFASAFSIVSAGSVLSILSIGSTMSILSVGSVDSVLSIGSNGCYLRFFGNCKATLPTAEVAFKLDFTKETWDNMRKCTFDEYQKFKKFEPSEDHPCDYHAADCSFKNVNDPSKDRKNIACKIRRKGFTTWESLDDKPSFKVKIDDDLDMGTIDDVAMEVDEFTLNNMKFSDSWSGHGEVEAYDLFRKIGFRNMPAAAHAQVTLLRDSEAVNTHSYALIQNVNDGTYMKALWKGQHPAAEYDEGGYMLFEVDNRGLEFKKGKKNFDTDQTAEIALFERVINREGDLLEYMDADDISTLFIGETLTGNWDGACLRYIPNNYYVAVTRSATDKPKVRYVPKGMDRVFQGCAYEIGQNYLMGGMTPPYCGPMQKVLSNSTTLARYEELESLARASAQFQKRTCEEDLGTLSLIIAVSVAIAFACTTFSLLAVYIMRRYARKCLFVR